MRPLVYHSAAASAVFFATVGVALVAELVLQARTQGDEPDPSYRWMWLGSTAGTAVAFATSGVGGHLPGPAAAPFAAGLAAMWAGIALRTWAVRTLGRFFRVEVSVADDQRVVDTGPYARLRHPSYTGLLLVYLGLGVALDGWLSVVAVLLPLAAVVNRIRHEERTLLRDLGDGYRRYAASRRRLVPGVW